MGVNTGMIKKMILQQEGSAIDWHIIITRYFPLQLDPPVHELIWTLRFHDPPKDSVQISPVHGPNLKIFIMTTVEIIYLFSIFFKVVHSYTLTPAIQNLFFFFLIIIKLPFFFPHFSQSRQNSKNMEQMHEKY